MRIVEKVLAEKCPELKFNVEGAMKLDHKTKDKYDKSIITVDHSVCGVGSANIPKWLPEYNLDAALAQAWDSFGIEVVSRVYHRKSDPDNNEIRKIIETVKCRPGHKHGASLPISAVFTSTSKRQKISVFCKNSRYFSSSTSKKSLASIRNVVAPHIQRREEIYTAIGSQQ
jgi:hypothetical protein